MSAARRKGGSNAGKRAAAKPRPRAVPTGADPDSTAAPRATRPKAGGRGRDPVGALSHIAIATANADALAATLAAALGAVRGEEEMIDDGELRVLFVHLGPVTLELLEPRSVHHTVARFIGRRGAGLHHVSLDVHSIEEVLAHCRTAGVQPIDETPREGAHGTKVSFLHPKALGGVLIELCERPKAMARRRSQKLPPAPHEPSQNE